MDKNELERRLEAAEKQNIGLLDEIKYLKEQLAQMQDEPEIPDFPEFERGSAYWCVNDEFALQKSQHSGYVGEKGVKDDEALYNAFHTEEYAQEFADKCKLIAMMLHCKWYIDRDYVPDWEASDEWKYFVLYNNSKNTFEVTVATVSDTVAAAFSNIEAAQKCADWLNKHWKENENE